MSKLVVWIVYDELGELDKAKEAVESAAEQIPYTLEIKTHNSFSWPNGQPSTKGTLPDVLVLDLVEDGECKGGDFYQELRHCERQQQRPPAFVIIWSGRWDNPAAVAFADRVRRDDPFIYDLDGIKTKGRLKVAIEGIAKRIEEER